ncbi:MAG TPA: pilus assembly protein N-terminal domain-containing protein [Bryobacteraceae bacterium]|jgi:pilus assembly protein CpaC|nr:pilus assembly protein N-terminal domain-containing protein [Bryobacteraceae bacterium]
MTRARFTQVIAMAALGAGFSMAQSAEELRLTVGKSVVIDYPSDVQQISTSTPEVMDYSAVSNREILVHGKGLGTATLVVWTKGGQRTFYNVNVDMNLDPLRRLLKESFPSEEISARSSRDSISLNGRVSNKEVGDRAMMLAASFSKTVVNNLQLNAAPMDKQILLRVKFAELDRTKESQFGVNILSTGAGNTLGRTTTSQFGNGSVNLTQLNAVSPSQGPGFSTQATITDALNLFAFRPDLNIGAFIKALQAESILEILAEPNLVATNGKEAYFLVGGEFPVPILQGGGNAGAVTVQFREFGIRLIFTPWVTEHNTIKLHLKQEVSTIDTANGVTLNGFVIPALSTRRAETDVELAEGQSFVVAGLVDNRERDSYTKIPILGSLPIFGALFKSKDEIKSRTDLIVLVTPEMTSPLATTDARPNIYMPKDFLVRLDPKDVPAPPQKQAKNSKKR